MTDWGAFQLFVVFVAGAFIAAWALGRVGKSKREGAEEWPSKQRLGKSYRYNKN